MGKCGNCLKNEDDSILSRNYGLCQECYEYIYCRQADIDDGTYCFRRTKEIRLRLKRQ